MLTFWEVPFVTFLMYVLMNLRFHLYWNMLSLHLSLKQDTEVRKETTDRLVFCLSSPRFWKSYKKKKKHLSCICFCLSTNVAFARDLVLCIAFLPCCRSGRKQLTPKMFWCSSDWSLKSIRLFCTWSHYC